MVEHNFGTTFLLLHHLLVLLLLLPLPSTRPLLLLVLVRRLGSPSDENLRRFVHRVLVACMLVLLRILAVVVLLLGLDLLDPGDPELHIVEEGHWLELNLFAEGGEQLVQKRGILLVESQVDILLFETFAEGIAFLSS